MGKEEMDDTLCMIFSLSITRDGLLADPVPQWSAPAA
jgi:hypothetical protein